MPDATPPIPVKPADKPLVRASASPPSSNQITTWFDANGDQWLASVNGRTFPGRNPPEAIRNALEYVSSTSYVFDRNWTPNG